MKKWLLRTFVAALTVAILGIGLGTWALHSSRFHQWVQSQIEATALNAGFQIRCNWNFKTFPFGLSGSEFLLEQKSHSLSSPTAPSALRVEASIFSFQYSLQLWPAAIVVHEIYADGIKIYFDQTQYLTSQSIGKPQSQKKSPEPSEEFTFHQLPQFPLKLVLEKMEIRNVALEVKSPDGSIQIENGSIVGSSQTQAELRKNILNFETNLKMNIESLQMKPHLLRPIPILLDLKADFLPLTGGVHLRSTLSSGKMDLVKIQWKTLSDSKMSRESRLEGETLPSIFQLPLSAQFRSLIKNYGMWQSRFVIDFQKHEFNSGKFEFIATQSQSGKSLQSTPIEAKGEFSLQNSVVLKIQLALEKLKYLTHHFHRFQGALKLDHSIKKTTAELALSPSLQYENLEFLGPTQLQMDLQRGVQNSSWKLLLSLPFVQWNKSHSIGNAIYEIQLNQRPSTKTGALYFDKVQIQSSLGNQTWPLQPQSHKLGKMLPAMGASLLLSGDLHLDETFNLNFQNLQIRGFANALTNSINSQFSKEPILSVDLNGSKREFETSAKGSILLQVSRRDLQAMHVDANAKIRIPLELWMQDSPKISAQLLRLKGDVIVEYLDWQDAKLGMALVGAKGHLPFSENLKITSEGLHWTNKSVFNPFLKVDFNRMSPLLIDAVDFKIDELKYLEKSYGPIGLQMELSENLLKIYQISALLNGADLGGEAILDLESKRIYGLLRVTGFNIQKNVPSSKMGKNLAGDSPIHFRTGFLLDPTQRSLDGRIDITQIDGRQLTTALNILDPKYEDNSLNSLRAALRVAYPSSVSADINQGQMDAEILLDGALKQKLRISSIPLGKLLLKYWPSPPPLQETSK